MLLVSWSLPLNLQLERMIISSHFSSFGSQTSLSQFLFCSFHIRKFNSPVSYCYTSCQQLEIHLTLQPASHSRQTSGWSCLFYFCICIYSLTPCVFDNKSSLNLIGFSINIISEKERNLPFCFSGVTTFWTAEWRHRSPSMRARKTRTVWWSTKRDCPLNQQ